MFKTEPQGAESTRSAADRGNEMLTLSDNTPDDDKFLFDLRVDCDRRNLKGKGMWDEIQKRYQEAKGGQYDKARLQMRVTRLVAKHGIWPDSEVSGSPSPITNK